MQMAARPLTFSKTVPAQIRSRQTPNANDQYRVRGEGMMLMNGEAILENVRRYRAIASLHRQTAAFRPHQRWSLLDQAEHWEHLALVQLEAYFEARERRLPTYH
jgi:hypothetical protein